MAAPETQKRFALDSNILLDLAKGEDFAHTFREAFRESGYRFFLPPTVVQELTLKAKRGTGSEKDLAFRALSCMREWEIDPFDLVSVGHGITEQFSKLLMSRGLLPEDEFNDGVIIAETALFAVPVLVTSDHHMLDIDQAALRTALGDSDLFPVVPFHPKSLLHAINIHTK